MLSGPPFRTGCVLQRGVASAARHTHPDRAGKGVAVMTRATRDRIWDAVPPRAVANERSSGQPIDEGHPLDLGHLDPATEAQVVARLISRDFNAWSEAASRV